MELYQLRSFVAVAEDGTLARAALRLFSSQPSVSAHIKALEDELGIPLFERSSRGMQITPDGEALLEKAYAILRETNALNTLARDLQTSPSGKLVIGVNTGLEDLAIDRIAEVIYRDNPSLQIELKHSSSGFIKNSVLAGEIDVGFFEGIVDSPKILSARFQENRVLVVASPKFKDALNTKEWKDLEKLPWLFKTPECSYFRLMEQIVKANELELNQRFIVDEDATCLRFVKNGIALSIMGESIVREQLEEGSIIAWDQFEYNLDHNVICLGQRFHERGIQAFLKACKEVLELPDLH